MMSLLIFIFSILGLVLGTFANYQPNWESLDSRPLPEWYDNAKIGIFIHWGVYSVPSFGSEWFWYHLQHDKQPDLVEFMSKNYPPGFQYQDFARDFTAEFFDAQQWTELFQKSGARYVVLTSKHHEGYTLWPSRYSYSWNSMDVGPHEDLVGKLAEAIRKTNLHFGLYHSLFEWYNPVYMADRATNFSTSIFIDTKIIPEMKELINTYKPEILWSDGDGEALDTYWKSTEFLAWLYNESPVKDFVVTNDRWGSNVGCQHGGYFTCADRYNPGHLLPRKWENCLTIDKQSWGYRRNFNLSDILTISELITTVVETVSCGGNVLINVGPTKEGTIVPIFQERLLQLGDWLSINGEGIYGSQPWQFQNDTGNSQVWFTAKNSSIYAFFLEWPEDNLLKIDAVKSEIVTGNKNIRLLGNLQEALTWIIVDDQIAIKLPDKAIVFSKWVWCLGIYEKQ